MKKKFDQLTQTAQVLLIRGLLQKKNHMELINFKQGEPLDIKFTVNGVEFDFEEVVTETVAMMRKDIDDEAARLLDQKICDTFALDELDEFLRQTRHAVRDKLEKSLNITIERDF